MTDRVAIDPVWLVTRRANRHRESLQVGYVVTCGGAEFARLSVEHNFPGPRDKRVSALTNAA